MGGRSPDQFRLSRLKEGERVCGGRGQFGKAAMGFEYDFEDSERAWKSAACANPMRLERRQKDRRSAVSATAMRA